jgi:hypothetical protein
VEQPTDHGLDPRECPPLIRPAVGERPALQLALQPGDLGFAESRSSRRPFRQQPNLAALAPGPAPPLHGTLADPQRSSDLRVLLTVLETIDGLKP